MAKQQQQQSVALSEVERLIVNGDLKALSPDQRLIYYREVCNSMGLNPYTKPFEYVTLSGKLTLYATKNCAEQLRQTRGISITKVEKEQDGDLYVVTCHARTPDGREDVDMGAVSTKGLQGEPLVNARLKAITKAKRRVTLSISGLGFLDETEIDSIADARRVVLTAEGEIVEPPAPKALPPAPTKQGAKPRAASAVKPEPVAAEPAEPAQQEQPLEVSDVERGLLSTDVLTLEGEALHKTIKSIWAHLRARGVAAFATTDKMIEDLRGFAFDQDWKVNTINKLGDCTDDQLRDYGDLLRQTLGEVIEQ